MKKPILIVSDSPDCTSGLARIGRDLAERLHKSGAKVGYCGYWGKGTGEEPYLVLPAGPDPTTNLFPIPIYANAFFEGGPGVVLTLYDPMWMAPLGLPWVTAQGKKPQDLLLADWSSNRTKRGVELWGSFPVDAHTPSHKLPTLACGGLQAWDKVAGWTKYGADILGRSINKPISILPLGLDEGWTRVKKLREKGVRPPGWGDGPVLGVVATNQQRKDWGLVFEAMSHLPKEWTLWAHVQRQLDYWNLPQLIEEYDLEDRVAFSETAHDNQLAALYAACAVTFAPGKGEGFGYPILESQLAGTPCVAINYAGGAELTPNHVEPLAFKPEGPCSFVRPVVWAGDLAHRLREGMMAGEPERWLWDAVWPAWKTWFKDGGVL